MRTPAEEALHYLETVIIPNITLITDPAERARVLGEYTKAIEAAHNETPSA
jgi:hypothetical protein